MNRFVRIALASSIVGLTAVGGVAAATSDSGSRPAPAGLPDDLFERSMGSIDQMQETLKQGIERLEAARAEKDLMRYNCINAKLKAIRGLVQIGEVAGQSLREAIDARDNELVAHNATKIDLARARVEAFRVELEACVGEQSQYTGGTEIESTIDPDIRQDNPTEGDILANEPIDLDRPFPATVAQ